MKIAATLGTVAIALALQLALARYTVGGRWVFDLVVVGVVYAALTWGPAAGMVAGTAGGLIQDVLSNDVAGSGGLAKTLVGFVAGAVGSRFVVARPMARVAMVAGASVIHRLLLIGIHALIDRQWPAFPGGALLGETLLNSVVALMVFQGGESWAGAIWRGRPGRRAGLKRREW